MQVVRRFSPYTVILGVLMSGALLVRCRQLDAPLLTFHPTRQYRSAMIARACYYGRSPEIPAWARRVATANRAMQPAAEPPLMEWVACAAYQFLGREQLVIGRGVAAVSWVLGAIPLYLFARRIASPDPAIVAIGVYLFLPYGIIASSAFQPDALMTLCSLGALIAIVRHDERADTPRLLVAGAAIAWAALVKPMSVFITIPAVVSLASGRVGWRGVFTSRDVWGLLGLGLLPPTLHYGYGAIFGPLARDQMQLRFVPRLLGSAFFWHGWWAQIGRVFGAPVFMAALLGALVAPRSAPRRLLIGLWVGYVAFGVGFTYHMPTHDYYHLPYIAVAALGIAAAVAFLERARAFRSHPQSLAWLARITTAVIVAAGSAVAWPHIDVDAAAKRVAQYEEIGALTKHHTRVVFLDHEYGYPLMYHGQFSGDAWPGTGDLVAESLGGRPPLDAETRFARDFADFTPAYFVVTDMASLSAQLDLQRLLSERATIVQKTPTYEVYKFVQ
jgi:Dolichyl-phosphate-mannose-protein mannosyltransferase